MPKKKPIRKSPTTKRRTKATPQVAKSNSTDKPANSKQAKVLELLRRPQGATIEGIMSETGWQQHSVRGFLAGVVRKRLKLKLTSDKADGVRAYRIAGQDTQSTTSVGAGRASR
jgi:transglutaminase/protease-like cytokinesis protein 3